MAASFLAVYQPAHASVSQVDQQTCGGAGGSTTCNVSLGTALGISDFILCSVSAFGGAPTAPTDSMSNSYTQEVSFAATTATQPLYFSLWTTQTTATAASDTVAGHWPAGIANIVCEHYNGVPNLAPGGYQIANGTWTSGTAHSGVTASLSIPNGALAYSVFLDTACASGSETATPAGMTDNFAAAGSSTGSCGGGHGWYPLLNDAYKAGWAGGSSTGAWTNTNGAATSSGTGAWIDLVAYWTASATTITTTSTTTTALTTVTSLTQTTETAGDGTTSGSSTYLVNNQEYALSYYHGPPSPAALSNITLKLSAVHMTTAAANLVIGFYMVTVPNQQPSSSYPMQLQDLAWAFSINNNSAGFIHVPTGQLIKSDGSPFIVCGQCYYGIGFFVNATHSRGSGASNSGVAVAQTTGGTGSWVSFADSRAPVSVALFWSGGSAETALDGIALLGNGVAVVTVSGTQTITTVTTINTVGVTTSLVPVSGCLGCGDSLGQSIEFAVMGFGLSQGVADWLLTIGAIIGFAAIGAIVMVGVGAMDMAGPVAALGGFGGLAISMGMGWLNWIYFALVLLVLAGLGITAVMGGRGNRSDG